MRVAPVHLRPGRPVDLPALLGLWRREMREGRRDSVPREAELQGLLFHLDWEARSRLVEGDGSELAGAVFVTSRPTPEGILARVDPSSVGNGSAGVMRELVRWGLMLSRAAGARAVQVWVGPGHADALSGLGLELVRPWWRMDRTLAGNLPAPARIAGYELIDASGVQRGSWEEIHNRTFAEHWRFSPRSEDELMHGKTPGLCLMALGARSGTPAAITLCQVETFQDDARPQPVGLVSSVGTLPEHRRRGLATWLVAEGMHRMRQAGARSASLYVDGRNETRAFDVYTKLGFAWAFAAEVWEATYE